MRLNIEHKVNGIKHSTGYLEEVDVRNIALQIGNDIDGNEFVARDVIFRLIGRLRGIADDGNEFAKNALDEIVHNLYGEFQDYEKRNHNC